MVFQMGSYNGFVKKWEYFLVQQCESSPNQAHNAIDFIGLLIHVLFKVKFIINCNAYILLLSTFSSSVLYQVYLMFVFCYFQFIALYTCPD